MKNQITERIKNSSEKQEKNPKRKKSSSKSRKIWVKNNCETSKWITRRLKSEGEY